MSTRNMTLVVDRSYAEEHEAGFAVKPKLVSKKLTFICTYIMMVILNGEV
jgi:hypothetical protein